MKREAYFKVNLISYVEHEIPLLELIEKRLSMDIHFKMARSNFYPLVLYSISNLERRFCDQETWIEKGRGPPLKEFTDSSPDAGETHGVIFNCSGKELSRCH